MQKLDDAQVYLPDLWATHARYQPDKPAIVCGGDVATWADFDRGMNRVANRLLGMGVGRGASVAVLMTNSVDMMCAMFGVVRAGARVVPISGLLTPDQVLMMLQDSGAAVVIVSSALQHLVEPVRDRAAIEPEYFIAHGFSDDGWTGWDDWLADAATEQPNVTYTMDQPFNVIYSSGTTGVPKGIVQTHRARQHWAWSNAIEMRFGSNSRALTTTALYSNGTWLMVLPVLFAGGTLHVLPEFSPDAFLETVQRERITHTFMVPTQYIVTLNHERFDDFDLSSLEVMLSAGSPLRLDTKREIRARMGHGLHELYGFSEGFATMLKPDRMLEKFDSVGTPVLGFDLAILDEDGNELPRGEVGEIAGYGAGLMAEYNNRPELVDEAIWRDARGRTFFRSGDVGRLDEDGYLYIVDRKKDMIISGGFNIFPADLEEVIGEHPDVQDVTVIGMPHDTWGETPLALVIPATVSADPEAIRAWANERLAKHQRIGELRFRDDFPRNALGKVLKRELREEAGAP
jgi:acyl-CoA synthetase (AMP-forming)/AMP-acid ligase II